MKKEKTNKEENKIKNKEKKIGKKNISVIALIIAVSVLILIAANLDISQTGEEKFSDCKMVVESCLTEECRYYFLCSAETSLADCKVYDCGEKYGVLMKKEGGEILTSTKPKPNLEDAQKVVEKCKGEIKIINKECKDNSLEISLEIETIGECEINAFLANAEENEPIQPLWKKEGNIFQLSILDNCDVTQIIAIGQGGIPIKKSLK